MYPILDVLWRLSSSDLITFVLPNTLFGVCTSLCPALYEGPASREPAQLAAALAKTILWNWLNLLLFNLSNQRLPEAVAEDKLNKPYRPIPSGLLSPDAARKALLYGIPAVVLTSALLLGAYQESIVMVMLTWMYNDLRGSDENFVLRNLIIATSFGVYNHASTYIAGGIATTIDTSQASRPSTDFISGLTMEGQLWTFLISLIIFTTMQIQDLQDIEGDKKRGRRTMMLTVGVSQSRWFLAACITGWSIILPLCLDLRTPDIFLYPAIYLGFYISWRVIFCTSKQADTNSWNLWAIWLISLYTMPLQKSV